MMPGVNSLKEKLWSPKNLGPLCLLSVILLPLIRSILTFNKLALISEGWFVTYSSMVLGGKTPYVDFELVFSPFFLFFNIVVEFIFGESLLVLRIIGIFLSIGITVSLYYLLKLVFPPWMSAVAAIAAFFVMQSTDFYGSYNYIRFYEMFTYIAFFFILKPIIKSYKKEPVNINKNLFISGFFCALSLLTRQTSGATALACFVVILIISIFISNLEFKRKNILFFFVGFSVPILIMTLWLVMTGTFTQFIQISFLSGTKGSIVEMLFGWIPRSFGINNIVFSIIVTIPALYILTRLKKKGGTSSNDDSSDYLLFFIFIALGAISIFVLYSSVSLSWMFAPYWYSHYFFVAPVLIFDFFIFLIILFKIITKNRKGERQSLRDIVYLFFCLFIFSIAFGASTSYNLTTELAALSFGFFIAATLFEINKLSEKKTRDLLKTCGMVCVLFLLLTTVSTKVVAPYHWWFIHAEHNSDAIYTTDISYLKGMKLTANEKYVYEDFVDKSNMYLLDDDELYCYSRISIFYVLADKIPNVKAPEPWFDVSRESAILEDLEYLKHNKPKMILFADHGYYALEVHEESFNGGKELAHRQLYEWLLECKNAGTDYNVIETYIIQNTTLYLMLRID